LVIGMYDQLGIDIKNPEQTMLEFVINSVQARGGGSDGTESQEEAPRLLRQFEFPRQRWNERLAILSGGEKRRLQMLAVLSQRPNCLIMDEPSVDCDLDTLTALESYLLGFDGVLIIVSHDRAFADKVTDHLFVFEGAGEVKDFSGSLSEYASTLVEMESRAISGAAGTDEGTEDKNAAYKEDKAKRNEDRNMIRRAKKDMENLEKIMDKLKIKAAALQKEIDDTSSDEGWSVLADLTEKLGQMNEQIEEKELQWMELAEQMEGAEVEVK
jgi:ATP-binding cassette subfamily F protein uup